MLSASYARLGSELSGLKLQAIISGQIDANNCLEWGEKISKADAEALKAKLEEAGASGEIK